MKLLAFLSIVLSVFTAATCQDEIEPRVKTTLGAIKGYYKISTSGRQYAAYEGIPYALPPTGKHRFQPPKPTPPWLGELPATNFGSECIQYTWSSRAVGDEDCLYLNVYVPSGETPEKGSLPVIFWIHGGAFMFGSGTMAGEKNLLDRDVIVVTINYRLGLFGFLSTEDDVVPGNMGLKDQQMALRWVSENIEHFGGNPKEITLVGCSAGGVSVHYHYMSPGSAGLFHRGLSLSGSALNIWGQTENSLEKTKRLATLMGCPTVSTKEMVKCLKYRPAKTLIAATENFIMWHMTPFTPFGPIVEKTKDSPFINKDPIEILSNGEVYDVPWVTGVTGAEGLVPGAAYINDAKILKDLDENWATIAPYLLDFNYTIPKVKHPEVAELMKDYYFGKQAIDKHSIKPLLQMIGDRIFYADSAKAALLQAKVNRSPVWYYCFNYRGASSLSEIFSRSKENYGASHGDDSYYVLELPNLDVSSTPEDREMRKNLVDFWADFASSGTPQVAGTMLPRISPDPKEFQYLSINGPGKTAYEKRENFGNVAFWDSIGFNENKLSTEKSKKIHTDL